MSTSHHGAAHRGEYSNGIDGRSRIGGRDEEVDVGRQLHAAPALLAGRAPTAIGDLRNVIRSARRQGKRVILGGHSLGAAISLVEAANYHDVDGVLSAGVAHYFDPVDSAADLVATLRRGMEALATAGAFDGFGLSRRQALWNAGYTDAPDRLACLADRHDRLLGIGQAVATITIILALATGICLSTMGFTLRDAVVNSSLPSRTRLAT